MPDAVGDIKIIKGVTAAIGPGIKADIFPAKDHQWRCLEHLQVAMALKRETYWRKGSAVDMGDLGPRLGLSGSLNLFWSLSLLTPLWGCNFMLKYLNYNQTVQ